MENGTVGLSINYFSDHIINSRADQPELQLCTKYHFVYKKNNMLLRRLQEGKTTRQLFQCGTASASKESPSFSCRFCICRNYNSTFLDRLGSYPSNRPLHRRICSIDNQRTTVTYQIELVIRNSPGHNHRSLLHPKTSRVLLVEVGAAVIESKRHTKAALMYCPVAVPRSAIHRNRHPVESAKTGWTPYTQGSITLCALQFVNDYNRSVRIFFRRCVAHNLPPAFPSSVVYSGWYWFWITGEGAVVQFLVYKEKVRYVMWHRISFAFSSFSQCVFNFFFAWRLFFQQTVSFHLFLSLIIKSLFLPGTITPGLLGIIPMQWSLPVTSDQDSCWSKARKPLLRLLYCCHYGTSSEYGYGISSYCTSVPVERPWTFRNLLQIFLFPGSNIFATTTLVMVLAPDIHRIWKTTLKEMPATTTKEVTPGGYSRMPVFLDSAFSATTAISRRMCMCGGSWSSRHFWSGSPGKLVYNLPTFVCRW